GTGSDEIKPSTRGPDSCVHPRHAMRRLRSSCPIRNSNEARTFQTGVGPEWHTWGPDLLGGDIRVRSSRRRPACLPNQALATGQRQLGSRSVEMTSLLESLAANGWAVGTGTPAEFHAAVSIHGLS